MSGARGGGTGAGGPLARARRTVAIGDHARKLEHDRQQDVLRGQRDRGPLAEDVLEELRLDLSPTSLACWRSRSDTFSSMAAVMVRAVRSGGCWLLFLRRLFESLSEEGSLRFFFELLRSAVSASWRFLRSSSCLATSCPSCVSIFSCRASCFPNAAMICCRAAAGTWTVPLQHPALMAKRGMAPQRRGRASGVTSVTGGAAGVRPWGRVFKFGVFSR